MVATPALLPRKNPPNPAGCDSYEEYHPYGTTAWWAGDSALVSQKRFKFTGMERDEETGLQCHGRRYYAVWLARWTSADPIGLGDGVNRFQYARSAPVGGLDVRGTDTMDDIVAGAASVPRAMAEPPLVVHDIFLAGYGAVYNAYFADQTNAYDEIEPSEFEFLSATAKRMQHNVVTGKSELQQWRAGLVLSLAMPTGGASGMVDSWAIVFEEDLSADQARSFLTQGATAQVTSVGVAVGVNVAVGNTPTGYAPSNPAAEAAALGELVDTRAKAGLPGDATLSIGVDTPTAVTESAMGDAGLHAEEAQMQGSGKVGPKVLVVDQLPCSKCEGLIEETEILGSRRVLVPRDPANPAGSPKTAAVKASLGKITPIMEVIEDVPAGTPVLSFDRQLPPWWDLSD